MDSPRITSWQIPGSDGQPIYGDTHAPKNSILLDQEQPRGVLICAHGFKGYKDYGFFPRLCEAAADVGLLAHRFNFSHSGMTNEIEAFQNPELFVQDQWSKQIYDLAQLQSIAWHVMDFPRESSWDLHVPEVPFVLFGHSRGGVSALLATARSLTPEYYNRFWPSAQFSRQPPAALITAAAPDYACNLDDLAKEQLRAEGRLLSPSGRTGQDLYVGRDWLDEIERDPELYDPVLAAAHVKCPTLIIHGSGDTTVPVDCAHNLHRAATPNSRLEIIEGASHTFDCPNPLPIDTPWDEVPAATRELIDLTVAFAVEQCEKARGSA